MDQTLRELFNSDPDAFRRMVKEILTEKKGEHPRKRTGRLTKRTPDALALMWAKIEFLKNRDGKDTIGALQALARHDEQTGDNITQYDTSDNRWRPGEEEKPPVFVYRPKWNRQDYYDFYELSDEQQAIGRIWLEEMQAAHNNQPSALDDEFMRKTFPPKK